MSTYIQIVGRGQYLSRRAVLGAGLFAGTSLLLKACAGSSTSQSSPVGKQLVITTFAGSWEQFYRSELIPAFTANDQGTVSVIPMVSLEQVAKLKASPQSPPFDVVLLDEGPFDAAPKDLFQPVSSSLFQTTSKFYRLSKANRAGGQRLGFRLWGLPTIQKQFHHPQHLGTTYSIRTTEGEFQCRA